MDKVYLKKLEFYTKIKNDYKIQKYKSKLSQNFKGGRIKNHTKEYIIDFIISAFNDKVYARMICFNENHGFMNYEHFINHNRECVMKLSNDGAICIKTLIDKIKKNEIGQCDEEDFIEFTSWTIYFNSKGQLIIMNSR